MFTFKIIITQKFISNSSGRVQGIRIFVLVLTDFVIFWKKKLIKWHIAYVRGFSSLNLTLNRLFNNYMKLYYYWINSS